jgi:alpha-galactosidase
MNSIETSQQEMILANTWFKRVFLHENTQENFAQIRPEKQGCDICKVNRSLTDNPLKIGKRVFDRGLAVHAISEVRVTLPSAGKVFTAMVGRDQNGITIGNKANFTFGVEINGKVVFRTPTIHGGETAKSIRVPLKGASEFILRVDGVADWSHADWAEARVELENGQKLWLDEIPLSGATPQAMDELPFSFIYGSKPSTELLKSWRRTAETKTLSEDRQKHILTYQDPSSGLEVTCEAISYSDFPAVEWVVYFKNNGSKNTPILEAIQGLDLGFNRAAASGEYQLHYAVGSICSVKDFQPMTAKLESKSELKLSAENGRSSSGTLPFFNLEAPGGGVIGAIGWSGQWAASFARDEASGLKVRAGMERTHFTLHPGERARSPRMLLLFWRGDRIRSQNVFRQLVLKHYTPKSEGRTLECPISWAFWGMVSEAENRKKIESIAKKEIPVEYFWIDAGWYGECKEVNDWYAQSGNWSHNTSLYPNGLKPVSDSVHKAGKKFLLWFDPERVYKDSKVYREHREWLLTTKDVIPGWCGRNDNFLFNMGNPEARKWITDLMSQKISEYGVDIFREDFNIDPLHYWQDNDTPNRLGITELKYIEGFYAFWDELLQRHPGLIIDNCASGGRRIDLETIGRSVPLWRSDLQCCPDYSPAGSQSQTFGLASWVPLNAAGCRNVNDTYDFRSAMSSGTTAFWTGIEHREFPAAWARKSIQEAILVRPFHYGNFYPLTEYNTGEGVWMAYQLDRPDLGQGVVIAYRRSLCPYPMAILKLFDLDRKRSYRFKNLNTDKSKVYQGAVLMDQGLKIELGETPKSVIFWYAIK